jgi:2-keto-4-pentenoate hydratase/2-oxohepta-3-ene-1,7-dioic acid hydratase in catechol pathway
MRLARLGPARDETPVLLVDDVTFDLTGVVPDLAGGALSKESLDTIREAALRGLPQLDAHGLRYGPPIARPGAVYCIGQNYAAHAAESGSPPPEIPIMFLKPPNTVVGPFDDVAIPPRAETVDWEVELGVVIGERAAYLESPAVASEVIAGYVIANDVSERTWQREESGGQWAKGKSAAGFLPLGPWLVTPDEVDAQRLRLRSWVNGEPRQDSSTADMVFSVVELVHHLSQYLVLEPGDLIITGTPEGVAMSGRFPYLKSGDVVELEIDGLGRQRTQFR